MTTINVVDPELPLLVSDAAVELDLLIQGDQPGLEAVRQLGDDLRKTLAKPAKAPPSRQLHVNTETETILGQAFCDAGGDPSTILRDLSRYTEEIATQLSSAEPGGRREDLERLREFCLALSRFAAAYRQSMTIALPPHPDRR